MKSRSIALFILLALLSPFSMGQSIDLGRGELPVTVPDDYNENVPTPLIVALHGYTGSGEGTDRYMGLSAIADDYDFLLVKPNGRREPEGDANPYWNASVACCNFYDVETDDVAYIKSVIDEMKSRYNVDPTRVYLIGHSNGGFMSYRMAREHPETIAAIASLAGAIDAGPSEPPASPVHVLQIHGTADATIQYRGGEIQDNRYIGALGSVRRWAEYNGCESRGRGRELRDLDASLPGYETGVLKYNVGCNADGSAELWTISAGAHSPVLSDTYGAQVVEWLYAHPKRGASFAD
jgi:polyhydroxybutyrate depolymerase